EVRAAGGGRPLHHAEAIGCEDECRHDGSQLLGGAQRSTVQPGTFALSPANRDLELQAHFAAPPPNACPRPFVAEAHDLRLRPRARREEIGEHTSELQSLTNLVCRLLLEKKKQSHCSSDIITAHTT